MCNKEDNPGSSVLYPPLYESIYTGWTVDNMKAIEMSTKITAVHTKLCMYDIELSLT